MRSRLQQSGRAVVIFGSAPSQNETLEALGAAPALDWGRVIAFHLDEYVGTPADAPHSFRRYLAEHLFRWAHPGIFHGIRGEADDPLPECARYTRLLDETPPDIALLGIGENGHLAFNDPPCDFDTAEVVRVVDLAESCRRQQVNDNAFVSLDNVPRRAITLTIPTLMRVPLIFVMVPGIAKAEAVHCALERLISPSCPASILRRHSNAAMFLDRDSASRLSNFNVDWRQEALD
jgi:glucosamine-6-phosphate deaminase